MLRQAPAVAFGLWRVAVRAAYRLIYGPLSGVYEAAAAAASGGGWWDWQRATLLQVSGPRVLEIACGTGRLLAALNGGDRSVVGLDLSPQMARRAQRRSGAPVLLADARRLPFSNGAFSTVVMTFSGLTVDPAVLAEVRRVLTSGGRLVTLDEVALRGPGWRTRLARLVLGAASAGVRWPAHERMAAAGFRVTAHHEPAGGNEVLVLVGEREE